MHCPRCGQQQVTNETKFCSKCGFQLHLVPILLANGGTIPELNDLANSKTSWFTRKNGLIFSVLWLILWLMMMPAFFGIAGIDELAAVSAVFGLFSSIMLFVISIAFLKKGGSSSSLPNQFPQPMPLRNQMGSPHSAGGLPPQRSMPAAQYTSPTGNWRTPDTGELASPSSVTEDTTKLLKKDDEKWS